MAEKNSGTNNPKPAAKAVQTHCQKPQASTHTPTHSLTLSLSFSLSLDLSQLHCGKEQQKGRENSILPTAALQKQQHPHACNHKSARCNSIHGHGGTFLGKV